MTDKPVSQNMGNINAIQTLRAIAALIVLLSHLAKELKKNKKSCSMIGSMSHILDSSVLIFFL